MRECLWLFRAFRDPAGKAGREVALHGPILAAKRWRRRHGEDFGFESRLLRIGLRHLTGGSDIGYIQSAKQK
jgi:hypothetical protein